jgi:CRISPR/Cas system CSM-associated protein Csm3 (group 7 of RAMP superfamily)
MAVVEKTYVVSLKAKEPLRIGTKKDPLSASDNPVARVGSKLAIPGTSLKGALRAEIERYLIESNATGNAAFKPCIPGSSISPDEGKLVGKYRDSLGSCHYPCTDRKCRRDTHPICPACYLLGAMGVPGFVKVPFLFAEVPTTELYSARMDRATGTVKEGTNRPYELVPDGTVFTGQLSVLVEDPLLDWKLGQSRTFSEHTGGDAWLKDAPKKPEEMVETFILARLKAIKRMGGYKSKGFGEVDITVTAK